MEQFRDQKRGGLGVKAIKLTRVRGKLVGARAVLKGMEVFVIASSGVAIRTKTDSVSRQKREASGVKVIDLPDGVTVSAFTPVDNEEE
jgi:DNA gyrase subunit A